MDNILNMAPWILLFIGSCSCVIFLILICLCWRSKKYSKSQLYKLTSGKNKSNLATNMPKIISGNKQKYFSQNSISYSSINNSQNLADEMVPRESFPFGIFNLFRHIQRNKFKENENDLTRVFTEDLEASNTEVMIKKFDKSVLCLNWNDNSDDSYETLTCIDKNDAYSCISGESRATFKSAVPNYNRCNSIAETFKSVNSNN